MAIGKSAMVLVCFMIACAAIVSIFAIAHKDVSTNDYYKDANNSVNLTVPMTEQVTGAGSAFMTNMILVVAIMFLFATLLIFRKK